MNRDPKTGKELDFKFLHMTDVQMSFNSAAPNGTVPVANMAAQQAATQPVQGIAGTAAGAGTAASAVTQEPQPLSGDQNANSQADQEAASAPPPQPLSPTVGANGAPQVFGGGAIVASASKAKSIREFNKKDHYNQWQFIYDPTTDRGGLLMTPNQPPLQGSMQNMQQNGPQNQQPAQPGLPGQPGVTTQPQQPPQNQDTPLQQ
jgi:hypothetical protein